LAGSAHPDLKHVHGSLGNRIAAGAGVALLLIVAASLLGPWFNPNGIETLDWSNVAMAPGTTHAHWFGTDRLGRDLFARTFSGIRVSLSIALIASLVSLTIGIVYGAVSGYMGGGVDHVMMRFVEILSGLPLVFFVIFLTVIFGRNEALLFAAIGAVGWLTMARIVRGQTLSLRQREFIQAAQAAGAGTPRIIIHHIIPNLLGPVFAYAALTVPQIILFESFLSFLGLGVQEPQASLGTLIAEGAGEMEAAPWMLLIPGAFLTLLLLALNLIGDALRDAFDAGER
jgi:oligopeptide transport system permease protein